MKDKPQNHNQTPTVALTMRVPADFKEKLGAAAWKNRMSMTQLVVKVMGEALERYKLD